MARYGRAQQPDSLSPSWTFTDTLLTAGWESWKGERWVRQSVPFTVAGEGELLLRFPLERPECPPDTLHLYFEGVGWEASLEINDYFVGVHTRPFSPWRVALPMDWVEPGQNWLRLRLTTQPLGVANQPEPVLGIYRPVYLVDKLHLARRDAPLIETTKTADTVALVAPYYRHYGWAFDTVEALRSLRPVKKAGIRHIHFWYEADREMKMLAADLGLTVVEKLHDTTQVALINPYPFREATFVGGGDFWLDAQGGVPFAMDSFVLGGRLLLSEGDRHAAGIAIIASSFLCLCRAPCQAWLLFHAVESTLAAWYVCGFALFEWRCVRGKGYGLLTLIRLILVSSTLTLALYYCTQEARWGQLDWLRGESLLLQLFPASLGIGEIWLRALILLTLLEGSRYVFIGLIARIFRVKDLTTQVMGLDIAAAFPLIYFLSLPLGFLLVNSLSNLTLVSMLMVLLLGIYWVRQIYLNFRGLGGGRPFSLGMKFLYVCTFNIALLLIWL